MKSKLILVSLVIFAVILSACSSSPSVTATQPSNTVVQAIVNVSQNSVLGPILVDSKGMTLYIYSKDTPNTSNCYIGCISYWPPLLTNGAPIAGTGITASLLGTTSRTDGTTQVTYNGWPLYYFVSDVATGDMRGENNLGVWFAITPAGDQK
jgi:predicted lipoprotein with Yx(FWY)xxD motif